MLCGTCGKQVYTGSNCTKCDMILCADCVAHIGKDDELWYCLRCWEIGAPYLERIDKLQEEIDEVDASWTLACMGKVADKCLFCGANRVTSCTACGAPMCGYCIQAEQDGKHYCKACWDKR